MQDIAFFRLSLFYHDANVIVAAALTYAG